MAIGPLLHVLHIGVDLLGSHTEIALDLQHQSGARVGESLRAGDLPDRIRHLPLLPRPPHTRLRERPTLCAAGAVYARFQPLEYCRYPGSHFDLSRSTPKVHRETLAVPLGTVYIAHASGSETRRDTPRSSTSQDLQRTGTFIKIVRRFGQPGSIPGGNAIAKR